MWPFCWSLFVKYGHIGAGFTGSHHAKSIGTRYAKASEAYRRDELIATKKAALKRLKAPRAVLRISKAIFSRFFGTKKRCGLECRPQDIGAQARKHTEGTGEYVRTDRRKLTDSVFFRLGLVAERKKHVSRDGEVVKTSYRSLGENMPGGGMSRQTIGQVMARLEAVGLVEVKKQRGAREVEIRVREA